MANEIVYKEQAYNLFGIEGRMFNRVQDTATGLYRNQTFGATRAYNETGYRTGSRISVEIRFDDQCNNGAMSFAVTADIKEPGRRDSTSCGCLHDDVEKYFPEIAHLIKWHLTDTRGPMHYIANTVYHASNRDHNGHAAGEPSSWDVKLKFGSFPITFKAGRKFREWIFAAIEFNKSASKANPDYVKFEPVAVEHKKDSSYDFAPKYTFKGFDCEWYECPFDSLAEAKEFSEAVNNFPIEEVRTPTAYSKGKARDLNAARNCAVWPEATDEELSQERPALEAALRARLPALVAAFRADMDACGFAWADAIRDEMGKPVTLAS